MLDFIQRVQAALPEAEFAGRVWDADDLLIGAAAPEGVNYEKDGANGKRRNFDAVLADVDSSQEWQSVLADKTLCVRPGGNLWLFAIGVPVLDAVQAVQELGKWSMIVAEEHGDNTFLCALALGQGYALPSVSVVVPAVQSVYMTRCLATHRSLQTGHVEYIIVSNGTEAQDYRELLALRPDVLLHFQEPMGFPNACNAGVAVTRQASEVLVLVNDDTEMALNGWDTRLWQIVDGERDLGAISPVLSSVANRWQVHNAIPVPDLYEVPVLFYTWVAFPRAVWEAVGGLDPAFGMGSGEDIDHCLRIRETGRQLLVDPVTAVYHRVHGTFDLMTFEQFNEVRVNAATTLLAKWGGRLDELAPEVAEWAKQRAGDA